MTTSDFPRAASQLKSVFHDRHEARAYRKAMAIAQRLVRDPSLVSNAKTFLEKFMSGDPHQKRYYDLWTKTLELTADEIASALLEDSDLGAELRASAPVFIVVSDAATNAGFP